MQSEHPATAGAPLRALILANGERPERAQLDAHWPGWDARVGLVIAADGGAEVAGALGLPIDLIVGDADSIDPDRLAALAATGIPVERSPAAKDASDTELAVLAALRRGATHVTIVGALGGPRLEHLLANLQLLALPALDGRVAEILSAESRVTLLRAPGPHGASAYRELRGRPGDYVSLFPLGERAEGIITEGLAYALRNEPLMLGPARGLSNVRTGETAAVSLRSGVLLIVETIAGPPAGGAIQGGST